MPSRRSARRMTPSIAQLRSVQASAASGVLLLAAAAWLAGCATRAEVELASSGRRSLDALPALAARLSVAGDRRSSASVVATRAGGLLGAALDPGREQPIWQRDADVSEPPLLAGRLVVFGQGAQLQALDALDGAPLWSLP